MSAHLIRITSDVEIPYLTYAGQPVLTFALIDKVHNRVEGTAKRNFSTNRKRFIDGEDYFYVTDSKGLDEIRTSHSGVIKDAAREITLITESGYLMLVKSFTDDLSWQIQRQLVKLYFRIKESVARPNYNEALERMTANDMHNLTRLVWCCAHRFYFKRIFVYAIWARLRAVTGTSSPQRFAVQQIPTLAAEIRRIFHITSTVNELITNAEKAAARRIFRHGENATKVLAEIERELAKAHSDDLYQINGCLSRWDETEIAHLVERRSSGGRFHPEFEEPLALHQY